MNKQFDWFSDEFWWVSIHIFLIFVGPVLELFFNGDDCAAEQLWIGVGMLTMGWTFFAVVTFITSENLRWFALLKWPLRVLIFLFVMAVVNIGVFNIIEEYTDLDPQSCERDQ